MGDFWVQVYSNMTNLATCISSCSIGGTSIRSMTAAHLPSSPAPVTLAISSADRRDLYAEPIDQLIKIKCIKVCQKSVPQNSSLKRMMKIKKEERKTWIQFHLHNDSLFLLFFVCLFVCLKRFFLSSMASTIVLQHEPTTLGNFQQMFYLLTVDLY